MISIRPAHLPAEAEVLFQLWDASCRATHTFLSTDDIDALAPDVRAALAHLEVWVADMDKEQCLGWMGLEGNHVEALFVAPENFGRGVGTALLDHARTAQGELLLDVNEQNPAALEFYKRKGFVVTGRSDVDGAGRPYPLIHLRWPVEVPVVGEEQEAGVPGSEPETSEGQGLKLGVEGEKDPPEQDVVLPNELLIYIMETLAFVGRKKSLANFMATSKRHYVVGLPLLYRELTLAESGKGTWNPHKWAANLVGVAGVDPLSCVRKLHVDLATFPGEQTLLRCLSGAQSLTVSSSDSQVLHYVWNPLRLGQAPHVEAIDLRHHQKTPEFYTHFVVPFFPSIPKSVRKARIQLPLGGDLYRLLRMFDRATWLQECHLSGAVHRADAARISNLHPNLWTRITSLECTDRDLAKYAQGDLHLEKLELRPWDQDGGFWNVIGQLGSLKNLVLIDSDTKQLLGATELPFDLESTTMVDPKLTTWDFDSARTLLDSGKLGRIAFKFSRRGVVSEENPAWERREREFWKGVRVPWLEGIVRDVEVPGA